jgi:hypothetical protein
LGTAHSSRSTAELCASLLQFVSLHYFEMLLFMESIHSRLAEARELRERVRERQLSLRTTTRGLLV